jgi:DNA replication protein DnaC
MVNKRKKDNTSENKKVKKSSNDKHSKQKKRKEGKKQKEKIRSIKYCGISRIYYDKTFSNFKILKNSEVYYLSLKFAKEFRNNEIWGKGLFLVGIPGSGKTHLLAAIIDYIARLYKRYLEPGSLIYRKAGDLIAEIEDSISSTSFQDLINRYKTVPLLLLDDLERTSKELNEIIDYRYKNSLPIVMTSTKKFSRLSKTIQRTIRMRCKTGFFKVGDFWLYRCEKILKENKIKLHIT